MTYECTRLAFARICVELDAAEPPVHSFDLLCDLSPDPFKIRIEYEWKPKRCLKCHVFGHNCHAAKVAPTAPVPSTAPAASPSMAIIHRPATSSAPPGSPPPLHRPSASREPLSIGLSSPAVSHLRAPTPIPQPLAMIVIPPSSGSSDLGSDIDSVTPLAIAQESLLDPFPCTENCQVLSPPEDDSAPPTLDVSLGSSLDASAGDGSAGISLDVHPGLGVPTRASISASTGVSSRGPSVVSTGPFQGSTISVCAPHKGGTMTLRPSTHLRQ